MQSDNFIKALSLSDKEKKLINKEADKWHYKYGEPYPQAIITAINLYFMNIDFATMFNPSIEESFERLNNCLIGQYRSIN